MANRCWRACAVWSVWVVVLLSYLLSTVAASHFRGGLIYWKTVGPANDTSGLVPVEVTQRFGWRRDYSQLTLCDDQVV